MLRPCAGSERVYCAIGIGLILLLACSLRIPALSWLPAPNGDEGHWARYADTVYHGQSVELDPEHRASSPLFAYLLGGAMHLTGHSFTGMRLLGVGAVLAAILATFVLLARAGAARVGLGAGAVLAVHPWSVLWSRTAAVPYALALAVMTMSATLFWIGLSQRRTLYVGAAIVAVAISAHFSPLAIVLVPAYLAFASVRERRWVFREPWLIASVVAAALLVVPLALSMRSGVTLEAAELITGFLPQSLSAVHMILSGFSGESTVRHFTNFALPLLPTALVSGALCLLVGFTTASRAVRQAIPIAGFALCVLSAGVVFLPLVLVPGRLWYLPTIDSERYLFVLLPGLALCTGALLQAGRIAFGSIVAGAVCSILLTASVRVLVPLAFGHGVARGPIVVSGGECYRGWLTTREHAPAANVIANLAKKLGAVAVLYDGYPLQTMQFVWSGTGPVYAQHRKRADWKDVFGRYVFVLWAKEAEDQTELPEAAQYYEARMRHMRSPEFSDLRLESIIRQPDGTPLFEVWSAVRAARR